MIACYVVFCLHFQQKTLSRQRWNACLPAWVTSQMWKSRWKPIFNCILKGYVNGTKTFPMFTALKPFNTRPTHVCDAGPTLTQQWANVSCLLVNFIPRVSPPPSHCLRRYLLRNYNNTRTSSGATFHAVICN